MISERLVHPHLRVVPIALGIFAAVAACSGGSSDPPSKAPEAATDTSIKIPEDASPANRSGSGSTSTPSSSASSDAGTTDASSKADGAIADASVTDGSKGDAKADAAPVKLAYGSACTSHEQCAGNLCLVFDGKLACTRTCKSDDDCENGDDCDGDIKVCEID